LGPLAGDDAKIPPGKLVLDPENLRLLEKGTLSQGIPLSHYAEPSTQRRLREVIADPKYKLGALVQSIRTNGFLDHERLIVAPLDGFHYLVLEGNRRLAAVLRVVDDGIPQLEPAIQDSIQTLPCFILRGQPIDNSKEALADYRRQAEIYIGLRHLMGARAWEPASRYEFQKRLLDEGWTPEQVADAFGRDKTVVVRDLKAQVLYRHFLDWESTTLSKHTFTYNAFAEAARSPDISRWLGWVDKGFQFKELDKLPLFFRYLKERVISDDADDDEDGARSAEFAVRRLRDVLKLKDLDVLDALETGDFNRAELLFEERRHGHLQQRVEQFTKVLRSATISDFESNPAGLRTALDALKAQIERVGRYVK